jgi:hypothetical protein
MVYSKRGIMDLRKMCITMSRETYIGFVIFAITAGILQMIPLMIGTLVYLLLIPLVLLPSKNNLPKHSTVYATIAANGTLKIRRSKIND